MSRKVCSSWLLLLAVFFGAAGCAGETPAPPPEAQNADAPVPQAELTSSGEMTN